LNLEVESFLTPWLAFLMTTPVIRERERALVIEVMIMTLEGILS